MNKRVIFAFVILLFLSLIAYQGYETKYFYRIPFYAKHLINFGLLALIALVGWWGLSAQSQKWMSSLWILLYAVVIMLMVIIGLLDLKFKFAISNFREMVHNLRMFFTTPVPFAFLLFLNYKMKRKDTA